MNRLQSELHRLYLSRSQPHGDDGAQWPALIGPLDQVRSMVMELTRPPSWEVLAKVWHGVQTELELPAPAIAVSGLDGLQLWFSLAEPIAAARAHTFLDGLRSRFLPDIEPGRLRLMPAANASALRTDLHAQSVPACQPGTGNWSAFLAPDLAPVFADTPWLDIPPNEEGQAGLLRGLETMEPSVFAAAEKRLASTLPAGPSGAAPAVHGDTTVRSEPATTAASADDATRFLLKIMNDETVALALRIEAAKALLQHSNDHRPPQRE